LAIWDEKNSPVGGNKIVELGTLNVNSLETAYKDKVFYNEAAPLSLPQGLRVGWSIGIEFLGTSETDYIMAEYNGGDPIDGAATIMSQFEKTGTDATGAELDFAWDDKVGRDLHMKIET
jgi:hypothetical protein